MVRPIKIWARRFLVVSNPGARLNVRGSSNLDLEEGEGVIQHEHLENIRNQHQRIKRGKDVVKELR